MQPISEALQDAHQEFATQTRTALAQATAAAARNAADADIPVCSTAHLKDIASAATRVFGWDQGKHGNNYNTVVISHEQWARIRELAQEELKEGDIGYIDAATEKNNEH